MQEIERTVDRATQLANQMLALARVQQTQQASHPQEWSQWQPILQEVALDLSPLIAAKDLDFLLHAEQPIPIAAPGWMLRELTRNLLHNAIRHSPAGAQLEIQLHSCAAGWARLEIQDCGPGISAELEQRLFQPFSAGEGREGSGLGWRFARRLCRPWADSWR